MSLRVHLYTRADHRSVPHVVTGFRKHGIVAHVLQKSEPCDLAVIWSYRHKPPPRDHYRRLMVFERGYVFHRKVWSSVGYDGLNGYADFCNADAKSDRWDRLFHTSMKPWREPTNNGYVLIAGQVPGDANLHGVDTHSWCLDMAGKLSATGLPVAIRWHPKASCNPECRFPVLPSVVGLREALAGARYLVTFNSNTAVDAVLAGVPAVTLDRGSMAYDVTGHDPLVFPPMPDRTQWAHRLAYTQWRMGDDGGRNEIANGDFWEHLAKGMAV